MFGDIHRNHGAYDAVSFVPSRENNKPRLTFFLLYSLWKTPMYIIIMRVFYPDALAVLFDCVI